MHFRPLKEQDKWLILQTLLLTRCSYFSQFFLTASTWRLYTISPPLVFISPSVNCAILEIDSTKKQRNLAYSSELNTIHNWKFIQSSVILACDWSFPPLAWTTSMHHFSVINFVLLQPLWNQPQKLISFSNKRNL